MPMDQSIVRDLEHESFTVVLPYGLSWNCNHIAMLSGDNGDAHINVGKQLEVRVIHHGGSFSDIACAPKLDARRYDIHFPLPDPARNRIPRNFYSLSREEAAHVGLVHICAYQHAREVGHLQY